MLRKTKHAFLREEYENLFCWDEQFDIFPAK
jgi:hypothetical protein